MDDGTSKVLIKWYPSTIKLVLNKLLGFGAANDGFN